MHSCGHEASWSHHQHRCVCHKKGMTYDWGSKKCYCTGGQVWNGRKCEFSCGRDAYFQDKYNKCLCYNGNLEYDRHTQRCKCHPGKHYDGRTGKCYYKKPKHEGY